MIPSSFDSTEHNKDTFAEKIGLRAKGAILNEGPFKYQFNEKQMKYICYPL